MVRVKIDGRSIAVAPGATVLEAAASIGIHIPSLCWVKELGAMNSCMVCAVRDNASGAMFPACSTAVAEGMDVDASGEEVRAARRDILRMLLAEHVGDCEGPCARICPAGLNVPRMLRLMAAGDGEGAARLTRRDLVFPGVLGYACPAPCQAGCRRGAYDHPVAIRDCHRQIAEQHLEQGVAHHSSASGKRIAILGSGIAGLSAAALCARAGHACRVFDAGAAACSTVRTQWADRLPLRILDVEIAAILSQGVELVLESDPSLEALRPHYDAVIVTGGAASSPDAGVFQASETTLLVKAVANGKKAARAADAYLRGLPEQPQRKSFNAHIEHMAGADLQAYAVERLAAEPAEEAGRCLHCDCLKLASCKLRQYADEYGIAELGDRFMDRPAVKPIQRAGNIYYEPGKCIKCGICVELIRGMGHDRGLTFAGRGLGSTVEAPFGSALAEGLGDAGAACVASCPVGALAYRDAEESR